MGCRSFGSSPLSQWWTTSSPMTGTTEICSPPPDLLDRKMASIYSVRAPAEGFTRSFDEEGGRRYLLGRSASGHAVPSSEHPATLRGQYVREVLLCQYIPPPPDVDIPFPNPRHPPRRCGKRVAVHLEDDFLQDVIRSPIPSVLSSLIFAPKKKGQRLIQSGVLDGHAFANAWDHRPGSQSIQRLPAV